MRMWNIPARLLCKQHLLGEHYEIHKAYGNLQHTGIWTQTLTQKGYLEPQNFKTRHDELVLEMKNRGYKHNTPLHINGIHLPIGHVDIETSYQDLISRCIDCYDNIMEEIL